ncbi:MAG TPA: carboxymuconolactone decarboxylase family protein [Nocardioides sp.]|nr:carboxymuconolactone decarboxylase family protein [Nocardioides sp.]
MAHVNISKEYPAPYEAQLAFDKSCEEAAEAAGLPKILAELVKIRVSQLNGCAFCLRMHTRDAVAAGETADRLAVLPAWWESQYFTVEEQAALTIAERVTRLGEEHTAPASTVDVEAALTAPQIAAVTWLAVVINGWNRIAVASHYPVAP